MENEHTIFVKPITLPRSSVPTYRELAKWLAQGNGEMLDENNRNRVVHSLDYSDTEANETLPRLFLVYNKIRKFDEECWHPIDIKYMGCGIRSWDLIQLYAYLASKFGTGVVTLQNGIITNCLYVNEQLLGTDLSIHKVSVQDGNLVISDKVKDIITMDKVTDELVMDIEKTIASVIKR